MIAKPRHGSGIQPLRPKPGCRSLPETKQWMVLQRISQPRAFDCAREPDGPTRKGRAWQCHALCRALKGCGGARIITRGNGTIRNGRKGIARWVLALQA